MEVFILVLIIIGFAVLIARSGDEERQRDIEEKDKRDKELKKKRMIEDKVVADKLKKISQEIIYKHRFTLLAERKKFLTKDSYGKTIDIGWYEERGNKRSAISYFLHNVLSEELDIAFEKMNYPEIIFNSDGEKFNNPYDWARDCFERIYLSDDLFIGWVIDEINKVCDEIQDKKSLLEDTSSMDGVEYEQYCKSVLEEAGWEVEDTPVSGDQGVDLIASIEDVRVCIQCKCFAKAVGNKAVQEVAAGMIHWKGTHAVVVAKSGFTKSAKTLAASNKVILTSDSELENLENLVL